ncbi:MAG: carbohydrate ABC transporter permease [Eubacteriales bacterium]|nr:carbohydrate ABC transporter permease [Eubacteriales bacterium]
MRRKREKEVVVYKKHHFVMIAFLLVFSVIMMYPMLWTIMTSFKTNADIRMNRTKIFPEKFSLEGFINAFEKAPIEQWFINSLFITVVVTILVILTSTFIGYVFAKYDFKGKKFLFAVMLATMMIPGQITMIPRYLLIQNLHMYDTFWALIIPSVVSVFGVYLAKQFIEDVPTSLCDAAKIDGAGPLGIYWHVILPNIKPAIGSIGIFTAMRVWNDYLNPLLMLNKVENMTLPLGLVMFDSQTGVDLAATMAVASMIMLPMTIIFLIFQKQFIRGLTMSGIK